VRLLAAALCLVSIASCAASQEPDRHAPRTFRGNGFALTIRKDVLYNAISPTPGVTLYDFHIGSQPLLFAYAGDKPGYPHFAGAPEREEALETSTGLSGTCRETSGNRECLIKLGDDSPKQLHVWYEKLDPGQRATANHIIQSARRSQ
jgi:hypothetical protein